MVTYVKCQQTLAILLRMKENHLSYHVFPGSKLDKPTIRYELNGGIQENGTWGFNAHGFRSTFRD